MTDKTEIGSKLKFARETKELTQREVMRLTGINSKTLSGYERDVAKPDLDTFVRLMRLYGSSADVLLGLGKGDQRLTAGEMKLLRYFRAVSRERQRDILIQLGALAKSDE